MGDVCECNPETFNWVYQHVSWSEDDIPTCTLCNLVRFGQPVLPLSGNIEVNMKFAAVLEAGIVSRDRAFESLWHLYGEDGDNFKNLAVIMVGVRERCLEALDISVKAIREEASKLPLNQTALNYNNALAYQ
jgi:hypothetical protein